MYPSRTFPVCGFSWVCGWDSGARFRGLGPRPFSRISGPFGKIKSKKMIVSVTEPTKVPDAFGSGYVLYKVNSEFSESEIYSVSRRYSDFQWLVEVFKEKYPGAINPPLPEKQSMGRFSSEFVQTRRRSLERFLIRVAARSELSSSEHFRSFLQVCVTYHTIKTNSKSQFY